MYYLIILVIFIIDRLSKWFINKTIIAGESVPLIENILHLTYVKNTGAAFSNFQGQTSLLILVTSLLILALFVYMVKRMKTEDPKLLLAFALIIAGGLGNLFDRIAFGYVIDFLDFRIWPVFNLADTAIVIGCFLMLINVIRFGKRDGKQ